MGTHPCFVGPFSSYLAADPPVQHPGYRDIGWTMDAPGFGDGLRRRVGVRHEGLRGRLESLYYCFGEYDIVGIGEFPSNDAAAAFSLAAAAGGAAKAIKTTPLLTIEEVLRAMRKASEAGGAYRPPR